MWVYQLDQSLSAWRANASNTFLLRFTNASSDPSLPLVAFWFGRISVLTLRPRATVRGTLPFKGAAKGDIEYSISASSFRLARSASNENFDLAA